VVSVHKGAILSKISMTQQLGGSFLVARHSKNDNIMLLSKLGVYVEL
jgi:hypothetical protein